MDKITLREHLAQLHAELLEAHKADPKSRQLLDDKMRDIKQLIDKTPDTAEAPDDSLPDQLEGIAVQFEADHPTLAASARRLVDLLVKVGI